MASVKNKLKEMKKSWKKAAPKEGFSNLPDGSCNVRIDKASVGLSNNTDRLQIQYDVTVLSGEAQGRTGKKFAGLDSDESMEWAKGDLVRLDVEPPDDIADLPEILESLTGVCVAVTIKTKDEYTNIFFNEVIDDEDVDDDDDEDEEEEDDSEEEEDDEESDDDEEEDEEDSNEDEEEEEEEEDEEWDVDNMSKKEILQSIEDGEIEGISAKKAKNMKLPALRKKVNILLEEEDED